MAGVNDLGGTLMDENISRAAGAEHGQAATEADFEDLVAAARPPTGTAHHAVRADRTGGRLIPPAVRPRRSAPSFDSFLASESSRMTPESLPKYRTGDAELDQRVFALLDEAGIDQEHGDADLVFELMVSALRLGREGHERGDLKIASASLKEMRYSFEVFRPYREVPKVAIFGSARTPADDPDYHIARDVRPQRSSTRAGWPSPAPVPAS